MGIRSRCNVRVARNAGDGMALVAVMWMVAALSLLAISLASSSRGEVRSAQSARAFAEAAAWGDAAIELAVRELRFADEAIDRRVSFAFALGGRQIQVRVSPANGFINLNAAGDALLRDLFQYGAGLDADAAEVLAQRVEDWRDSDDAPLPLGAEDEAYEAAGVTFRTRGSRFDSPQDLLQVLGVSFDIYDKIRRFVTTQTEESGVDPLAASPGVLAILARGNIEAAHAYAQARDAMEAAIDTTAFTQEHLLSSPGSRFFIEAFYPLDGGGRLVRARWVDPATEGPLGLPWRSLAVEAVRAAGSDD